VRVLYVLAENLNRSHGGLVHFLAVARGLQRLGHDVTILGPQYGAAMRRQANLRGIYIPVLCRSALTFLAFQVLSALFFPLVWVLYRPEVVLIRGGWGLFFLLSLVARLFGVPTVVEVNGIAWAELESRGFPRAYVRAAWWTGFLQCRTADRIITVTPAIGEELARAYGIPPECIFPIQNGADPDQFDPGRREAARRALSIPPEKFVVGFTGVFAPWHGVLELAESARYLPPDVRSQVLYLMVGHGQVWEAVRRRVDQWGLGDVVRLPGMVPHSRIAPYYAAFDLGVFVSTDAEKRRYGTSSLKFWEYLAAGLPVLVSDDCNVTPIVEGHRMGMVVRDVTPETLAASITETYRRRQELAETGRRNRELVIEKFSWLEVARRVAKVCAGEPLGPADAAIP